MQKPAISQRMCNESFKMGPYNCKDRLRELMTSEEFSDCVFIVENVQFNAHRLILSIVSPVFKAMLNGHWASSDPIVITDIDSDIFRNMLEYMYVDQIDIETIQQACNLLYASKKYMISYLVSQCVIYIEKEINVDNALQVYCFCRNMQEEELTARIFNYICKNANLILWNNLENIDAVALKTILREDKLNIEEYSLICFVFEWSKQQCLKMGVPVTAENRRNYLVKEGFLKSLRFLSLRSYDGANISLRNGVLSDEQITFIQSNLILNELKADEPSEFDNKCFGLCPIRKPREFIPNKLVYCLRSMIVTTRPLVISEQRNSVNVRIRSDKTISIHCLTVPTQSTPEHYEGFAGLYDNSYLENIEISISLFGSEIVSVTNFLGSVNYNSSVNIDLDSPIAFRKDQWYRITFKWPRLRSDIKYQAVWRSDITFCSATIRYDEITDNIEYYNSSFLIGMKYTV